MTRAPRPRVTLKLATSLDGRIATASGESRWITGEPARAQAHRLRAAHGAVLVGSATVLADDPELTVRLPEYMGPQPLRVVADGRLRTPPSSRLALTAKQSPVLIVTSAPAQPGAHKSLVGCGVRVAETATGSDGLISPMAILEAIAKAGAGSVLLEGGGRIAASFLSAGFVDRLEWFRAPVFLGAEGRASLGPLNIARLADAPRFKRTGVRPLGGDLWESYEVA